MKPGDMILIDRRVTALVHTVKTPAQIAAQLPQLAPLMADVAACGALEAAVISLESPAEPLDTSIIVRTIAGWETVDGEALHITEVRGTPH